MPYTFPQGVCSLASLVPMIRQVRAEELAAVHAPNLRQRREISSFKEVSSIFIPSFGVYVSQQEIKTLFKVLENHLNASCKAMLAEHKELQEVKPLVLQNCMALDVLLAAQGGTCKVINTECCSFIS